MVVLLTEDRDVGLHDVEELVHHGAHTHKKARSKRAFQDVGQLGGWVHLEHLGFGIQVFFRRGKHHVTAVGGQQFAIALEGAGVAVKVFVGGKLQAVHKDAGHGHRASAHTLVGLLSRHLHQLEVALVQVAHGGHKGAQGGGL